MVEDLIFEIALLVFIFMLVGLGLTIHEFKNFVRPDNKDKKK